MEGELEISGKKYLLSGWVKNSKAGNRYLSLAVRPHPDHEQDRNGLGLSAAAPKPEPQEDPQEEIPF